MKLKKAPHSILKLKLVILLKSNFLGLQRFNSFYVKLMCEFAIHFLAKRRNLNVNVDKSSTLGVLCFAFVIFYCNIKVTYTL